MTTTSTVARKMPGGASMPRRNVSPSGSESSATAGTTVVVARMTPA